MEEIKDCELLEYKPAKKTFEMVDYLEQNKRVTYISIIKKDAEELLLRYNYINVITPFKYVFAKKEKDEEIRDSEGRHIYERDVDFSEYYHLYKKEREKYPIIFSNISVFEAHFKSIVSYHIVNSLENKICNSDDLYDFIDRLKISISLLNSLDYSAERKMHMLEHIEELKGLIFKYHDIYCFFDRISLGQLLTIYTGLNSKTQNLIYDDLVNFGMNLDATNASQLISRVFTLIGIRNCIAHNNSLEILVRFYDPKNKLLRFPRDRQKYISLINYLEKEKRFTLK